MVTWCILVMLPLLVFSQPKPPAYEFTGEHGAESWGKENPLCDNGTRQTPIDIIHENTVVDPHLYTLEFHNFDTKLRNKVVNNGNKVRIEIGENQHLYVQNGGLPGRFKVRVLFIFWPSMHLLDGERADLELVVPTYNADLYNVDEARGKKDGIATFSILYKISSTDNPVLEPLISTVSKIKTYGSAVKIASGLRVEDLLPASAGTNYYKYDGSEPHTPCLEQDYKWYIFADYMYLSKEQLGEFKLLRDHRGNLMDNLYRPAQPLRGRSVYRPMFRSPRLGFLETGEKPPTKKESCVDVFFVIDESCSVYEDMPKVKQLLLDVVDKTIIGSRSALMSLVRYHNDINLNFYHLNTTNNKVTKTFIETQPLGQTKSCKTQTYKALKFNSEFFFGIGKTTLEASHYVGIRPGSYAMDVMFVITDGVSIPMGKRGRALKEAQKIRKAGIELFTIGLNNPNDKDGSPELLGFVNDDEHRAFSIDQEGLADVVAGIINSADPCFNSPPIQTTTDSHYKDM